MYTHIHIYTLAYISVCMYKRVLTYVPTYIHTYIIYIYVHTHTYIHSYLYLTRLFVPVYQ